MTKKQIQRLGKYAEELYASIPLDGKPSIDQETWERFAQKIVHRFLSYKPAGIIQAPGRPRKAVNIDLILKWRAQGKSIQYIADKFHCGVATIHRVIERIKKDND